ncbi:MAG: pyridoxal-phosphate dependent enzyme, partial [Halobacteriaceae archaeon]
GKAEWFNHSNESHGGGSVKTRIAVAMFKRDIEHGLIDEDITVVESSSGNTATALARACADHPCNCLIVMLDDVAEGKIAAIREAGAEIEFIDAERGYDAALERVKDLATRPKYHRPDQYSNPANPRAHSTGTGPEIRNQVGSCDWFVAGIGTGGTICGVARAIGQTTAIAGFEPATPDHDIEGLKYTAGDHHSPDTLDRSLIDHFFRISTRTARKEVQRVRDRFLDRRPEITHPGKFARSTVIDRMLVDNEFRIGFSSGGAIAAVKKLVSAGLIDGEDTVVVPLPDRGDRYPAFW